MFSFAGRILHLCKVSSVLVHPFMRSYTKDKHGDMDGQVQEYLYMKSYQALDYTGATL